MLEPGEETPARDSPDSKDSLLESRTAEIERLFAEARARGGLDYLFTLVRVDGLSFEFRDPILRILDLISTPSSHDGDQIRSRYCALASSIQLLELVANLLGCIEGKGYSPSPFHHLSTGQFPNVTAPKPVEVVNDLVGRTARADFNGLTDLIAESYPDSVLRSCFGGVSVDDSAFRQALSKCEGFLRLLLDIYQRKRLEFRTAPKYYKMPRFQVAELLTNEDVGLIGIRIHFSNGGAATFRRETDSTWCENMMPSVEGVSLYAGDIESLRDEWK